VRIAFCILFRSSVISKSNGLDLANFTKSACFKTRQVRYRILRNGHFLSHGGCSKTRNQPEVVLSIAGISIASSI
jgi:hypothetical protein